MDDSRQHVAIDMCCVYIACFCYSPCVHKQVPGCTVTVAIVILCLPAAAYFYIVVSLDVVTLVLEMYACVVRDHHLCCLLSHGGISMYICALISLLLVQRDFWLE